MNVVPSSNLRAGLAALLLAGLALLTGCGGGSGGSSGPGEPAAKAPERVTVTSSAFGANAPIPTRFTCKGEGVSPPLRWSGVPGEARALALVVDDPDAPGGDFVHWVVFDIDPGVDGIRQGQVPSAARQAENSAGTAAYTPPCPPSGTHHYRFTLYALRERVDLPNGVGHDDAIDAISKAAVARGRLVGTFGS